MSRMKKGSSVNKYISDYCVLDLETTGVHLSSDEIIEIAAIKVRNDKVVAEFNTLVNPKRPIPSEASAVNHITDDMVKDAPVLEDVLGEFMKFVGDDVILGYNVAGFDVNFIYDKAYQLKRESFGNDYLDLLYVARRSLDTVNHKLETICKHYGIDTSGEHRALTDCYLIKECYEHIYHEFGNQAFSSKNQSNHKPIYTAETMALQELQELLKDIIADGQVTQIEFFTLSSWMTEHSDLQGNYPFDRVFTAIDKVLEDRKIDPDELEWLCKLFTDYVDPVKNFSCHDRINDLQNKHVCITGDFDFGNRSEILELISTAGCIIDNSVKKTTNILVVGAKGCDAWKTGNYEAKVQKALEYNAKGQNISIVEEKDFIPDALFIIEHPEECACVCEEKETTDWKTAVKDMLESVIIEQELPAQSLYLMDNRGRTGNRVTSYSVCIYEPDYPAVPDIQKEPTKNALVLNIKEKDDSLELIIDSTQFGDIAKPQTATIKQIGNNGGDIRVIIALDSEELVDYIKANIKYALAKYTSRASSFGCCSSFIECSDAKKCVHVNKLYSKACMYRHHLDAGRIFYGKNKNIE